MHRTGRARVKMEGDMPPQKLLRRPSCDWEKTWTELEPRCEDLAVVNNSNHVTGELGCWLVLS